jgi:hypothetical protein
MVPKSWFSDAFDDLQDAINGYYEGVQDAIDAARDAIGGEGADGAITDAGDDGVGPADDGPGPITDGGDDGMGLVEDGEAPPGDGDGTGPPEDEEAPPGGGDGTGPPEDDGAPADGGDGGEGHDHTADAVVDGVLGILGWLGHAAPGHVHSDVYWDAGVGIAQPEYLPAEAVIPENPLAAEEAQPAIRVVVVNPEATGQTIAFVLDGQEHHLDPARLLDEYSVDAMLIAFDRGGGFGIARYSLTEGVYEFVRTERGWDLVRKTFTVTLDNTANATAFHYLVGGETAAVGAGASRRHTDRFPITIAFDRGSGGQPAEIALPSGTYKIARSPETGLWDLFVVPQPAEGTLAAQP